MAKVRGLNHLTLGVANLQRSIDFYIGILGFELRAHWNEGAYLEADALWLCLSFDPEAKESRRSDYTHYAFDVDPNSFDNLCAIVREHAPIWKDNKSEGASLYFLDPDGHHLELHIGSLASRLSHYRTESAGRVTVL